jgi:adenine-specific DNA-methyltransferase
MPTLEFKGKPFVYSHHLSVPFRELVIDAKKSLPAKGGKPSLDDNLIIHGDNLEALKALLPRYAGKVDVIYIDPPYNTGNEGWAYNDNVNSPLMKEWLGKVVDRDDLERHDKWLCMMWPRLHLLWELLAPTGSIWISLDDNEMQHAKCIADEIFGASNFIACCIWHKADSPKNTAKQFSEDHDYLLVYAKSGIEWSPNLLARSEEMIARYKNPDGDPRGPWLLSDLAARNPYDAGRYAITTKTGRVIDGPPPGSYWRVSKEKFDELDRDGRIWWGADGDNRPGIKRFLSEVKQGVVPQTIWQWKDVGSTRNSKQELSRIMAVDGEEDLFLTPKPTKLIERIITLGGDEDSVVLDSFAGSGTTAHAVIAQNQKDNGTRRFVLVEEEEYADALTAERVRRVIKGVPNAKDETLKKGLGGSFTYCELGDSLDLDKFFDGKGAPSYEQVARYVVYTATGQSVPEVPKEPRKDWFVAEAGGYRIHLIYKPDLAFMRGNDAALTLPLAKEIAKGAKGKPVLVYAATKFLAQKQLTEAGITFCQLPYSVHRVLGEAPDV